MAIKLYYHKTTFQLITIDDGDESLIVGDDGSKVFEFYFGTGTALVDFVIDTTVPLTYEGRVIFERADGAKTNEVYLTPIAGGFYRYVIGDWVTAVDGDLKITARLKLGAVVTNFGIATIPVEDGVAPDDGSTVSQAQYDAVMGAVNEVITGVTPIAYDNSTSGLAAVDVQGAIDEVDADVDALTVRVTTAETDIDILEGRTTVLEDTIPVTYETIVDANIVRGRVTAVESGKEDVVDANAHRLRTTALETANMVKAPTWDPATGVITFPLFDGTYAYIDLPTELIFDTVVYDDVNQQLVFTLKDGTSFDVPIGDILTGMATQAWVTDNHYNKTQLDAGQLDTRYYTESEVNNLLQERVNRNLSVYTELLHGNASGNELIYVYDVDDNTFKKIKLSEIYSGSNTATGAFVDTATYTNLVAGSSLFLKVHNLTLQTNGDFRVDLRNVATDEVIFVKFPTITATNTLRVSTDNGTTYYNVVKNGNTMRASVVSGQLVRLQFDGTQFVADIQGDVEIVEEYSDAIESTFGQFNPHDGGVPIVREVQGRTIPALSNLVTNGNFATSTVLWDGSSFTISIVGEQLKAVPKQDGLNAITYDTSQPLTTGDVYLLKGKFRYTSGTNTRFEVGLRGTTSSVTSIYSYAVDNPTVNQWYDFSNPILVTSAITGNAKIALRYTSNTGTENFNDNIQLFNLKASHGVTATTGELYDRAVADIEAMLALNGGYISTTPTTHLEDSEFKSVGKNLFDLSAFITNGSAYYSATTNGLYVNATDGRGGIDSLLWVRLKKSTSYTLNLTQSTGIRVYEQGVVGALFSVTASTLTFSTNATNEYYGFKFVETSGMPKLLSSIQLEQGTVATTYEPNNTKTQKFNHGRLSSVPNMVRDRIPYRNGAYVLDRYVKEYTLTADDILSRFTSYTNADIILIAKKTDSIGYNNALQNWYLMPPYANRDQMLDNTNIIGKLSATFNTTQLALGVAKGTYATIAEAKTALAGTKIWYQLATPLLATEVVDVDGTLIQESVTTVEQLQNIPTSVTIEYSMDVEQTTKTLVHRDKLQQQEIDSLEDRATILEARKTVSHNVIYMSATAWSTYTRVDGEVYGVWNESTGVITMYYGIVGA